VFSFGTDAASRGLSLCTFFLSKHPIRRIALAAWLEKTKHGHFGSVRVAATAAVGRTLQRNGSACIRVPGVVHAAEFAALVARGTQ